MDTTDRTDAANTSATSPKETGLSALWEIRDGVRVGLAAVFFTLPPEPDTSGLSAIERAASLGWGGVIIGSGKTDATEQVGARERCLHRPPFRNRFGFYPVADSCLGNPEEPGDVGVEDVPPAISGEPGTQVLLGEGHHGGRHLKTS